MSDSFNTFSTDTGNKTLGASITEPSNSKVLTIVVVPLPKPIYESTPPIHNFVGHRRILNRLKDYSSPPNLQAREFQAWYRTGGTGESLLSITVAYIHAEMVSNLQRALIVLVQFETDVSPWIHPEGWLTASANHAAFVLQDITSENIHIEAQEAHFNGSIIYRVGVIIVIQGLSFTNNRASISSYTYS